jgi:hypothetical protein
MPLEDKVPFPEGVAVTALAWREQWRQLRQRRLLQQAKEGFSSQSVMWQDKSPSVHVLQEI